MRNYPEKPAFPVYRTAAPFAFLLALLIGGNLPVYGDAHATEAWLTKTNNIDDRPVTDRHYPPDSPLDLSLKGVVATTDDQLGYAIIRSADGQEFPFRAGDSIYGLAKLEQIHIDRVIIRNNGLREVLRLPIEFMAREHSGEEARKKEARRIVTDLRQKLLARDGMALIRMFGFEETYRNGGFVGFTVKVVGEDGPRMLEVLGVQEGDVITAYNGKRFAESLAAIESLRELKDATEVDVEIDRQGVPMFFHFDFNKVQQAGEMGEQESVDAEDGRPLVAGPEAAGL